MARPRHQPDAGQRRQVETLAGYGASEADISGLMNIDPKTLRKHYRQELDQGHVKANAKVAESLFRKAMGDGPQSVTAAIFWLKTRARWKEVSVHEHGGVPGQPIERIDRIERIILVAPDMDQLRREREESARALSALPVSPGGR